MDGGIYVCICVGSGFKEEVGEMEEVNEID